MKKRIVLGLSLAAMVAAGGAYAAQEQGRPKLDANGDGTISRAEAQAGAAALFARLDVNHDGKLDETDRELHRQAMKTRLFERLDSDGSGQISKGEFLADKGPGDKGPGDDGPDGDGDDGPHGDGPHGDGPHGDGPHGDGPGHGHDKGPGMHMSGGMMAMAELADTNHDGAISQAEFTAAAMQRFEAMDTNHDGQVTREERQAARGQMKGARQHEGADQPQG
jgi:hypothetical protein